MHIHKHIDLLEDILASWQAVIGEQYLGYKNHCYRMLHFCFALAPQLSDDDKTKMIIAAAHHDIGLWSASTVDYIPPSVVEARKYCQQHQFDHWEEEIVSLIAEHHKLTPYTKNASVEIFRQADLVDFSLGLVKHGVKRSTIKQVQQAFPNAGFHLFLLKGAWQWFRQHPLSMPPFMKW